MLGLKAPPHPEFSFLKGAFHSSHADLQFTTEDDLELSDPGGWDYRLAPSCRKFWVWNPEHAASALGKHPTLFLRLAET